jgi:hypothetical protein
MAVRRTNQSRSGLSRDATIAVLLVVLIGGGLFLIPWLRPERFTATALFDVSADEISYTGEPIAFDQRRHDIFCKTQIAYLHSYFVLQSALRTPGIGALSILAPHEDKVQWMQDNLDVGYESNSEILHIELHGTEDQSEDLRAIVDAVCDAYVKEVIFEVSQRQLVIRDSKERASEELRKKLERLIDERNTLTDGLPETKAKLETANIEIDALSEFWRGLLVGTERDAFQDRAPGRIRLIQKANVTSENDSFPGKPTESRD